MRQLLQRQRGVLTSLVAEQKIASGAVLLQITTTTIIAIGRQLLLLTALHAAFVVVAVALALLVNN